MAAKKAPSGHKSPQPPPSAEPKGATSAVPTHRGGDATSWAATMDKEDEEREQGWDKPRARSHKRRREASRSWSAPECLSLPFPLQSDEERKQACKSLYEAVRDINVIQSNWMFEMIMACLVNDRCSQGDVVQFTNLLLASLAEYHMTTSVRPHSSMSPILPKEINKRLPDISEYMPPEDEFVLVDVRLKDAKAAIMRLAAWLHRVRMYSATDPDMAQSQRHEDHQVGPLLQYFLAPGCVPVTSDEVIDRVVTENLRDAHSQLQGSKAKLRKLKDRPKDLQEVQEETRTVHTKIYTVHVTRP